MVLQVFPKLYLPLMTEGNLRALRPWRMYLPSPSWFRYRRGLAQLDAYVIRILNERWHARAKGSERKPDLLEKRLDVILVRPLAYMAQPSGPKGIVSDCTCIRQLSQTERMRKIIVCSSRTLTYLIIR